MPTVPAGSSRGVLPHLSAPDPRDPVPARRQRDLDRLRNSALAGCGLELRDDDGDLIGSGFEPEDHPTQAPRRPPLALVAKDVSRNRLRHHEHLGETESN